jgi:hypothetical protein
MLSVELGRVEISRQKSVWSRHSISGAEMQAPSSSHRDSDKIMSMDGAMFVALSNPTCCPCHLPKTFSASIRSVAMRLPRSDHSCQAGINVRLCHSVVEGMLFAYVFSPAGRPGKGIGIIRCRPLLHRCVYAGGQRQKLTDSLIGCCAMFILLICPRASNDEMPEEAVQRAARHLVGQGHMPRCRTDIAVSSQNSQWRVSNVAIVVAVRRGTIVEK